MTVIDVLARRIPWNVDAAPRETASATCQKTCPEEIPPVREITTFAVCAKVPLKRVNMRVFMIGVRMKVDVRDLEYIYVVTITGENQVAADGDPSRELVDTRDKSLSS